MSTSAFERRASELRQFAGHRAARDPPAGFQGELRGYQREGLGWLHFLREFGFGGCLADDMGLGKTVQVLALLEAPRREPRQDATTAAVAGRGAAVAGLQLDAGGRALHAAAARARLHRHRPRQAPASSSTTTTSS